MTEISKLPYDDSFMAPKCEGVPTVYYHGQPVRMERKCKFAARYVLDGRKLCRLHAGDEAIGILLQRAEATQGSK